MFSHVLCVHRWWRGGVGSVPACITGQMTRGSLSRAVSVQGKLFYRGGVFQGGCVQTGLYPGGDSRVPTRPGKPGKPGKMRVHLENLEISWNFEKFNKYHGKTT